MSPREDEMRLLQSLPEDVTYGEIMTAICVRIKIEAAIIQLDSGQGIEHDVASEMVNDEKCPGKVGCKRETIVRIVKRKKTCIHH